MISFGFECKGKYFAVCAHKDYGKDYFQYDMWIDGHLTCLKVNEEGLIRMCEADDGLLVEKLTSKLRELDKYLGIS